MAIPERVDAPRIHAAGVVALRGRGKRTEVLVVHRPDRNDWSLPKGKVDPGERLAATAVRETMEETGVPVVLGVPLPKVRYLVIDPRSGETAKKTVHYWRARVTDAAILAGDVDVPASWSATHEIGEVRWVRLHQLPALLTYPHDLDVVQAALDAPRHTSPLVVVRHAQAEKRSDFRERVGEAPSDGLRPLTPDGVMQAQALVGVLGAYGVTHVASSSWQRCMDTVRPYADAIGTCVEAIDAITEEAFALHPKRGVRDVLALLDRVEPAAVCIHRPTKKRLVLELGRRTHQPVDLALAPAEYLVFHRSAKVDAQGDFRKIRVGEGTNIEYGLHHV